MKSLLLIIALLAFTPCAYSATPRVMSGVILDSENSLSFDYGAIYGTTIKGAEGARQTQGLTLLSSIGVKGARVGLGHGQLSSGAVGFKKTVVSGYVQYDYDSKSTTIGVELQLTVLFLSAKVGVGKRNINNDNDEMVVHAGFGVGF